MRDDVGQVDMEDFGAPSFSLGIEELHDSFNCQAIPHASNFTPVVFCAEEVSDFKPTARDTASVLRRLKRGPSQVSGHTTGSESSSQLKQGKDNVLQGFCSVKKPNICKENDDKVSPLQNLWERSKYKSVMPKEDHDRSLDEAEFQGCFNNKKDFPGGSSNATSSCRNINNDGVRGRGVRLSEYSSSGSAKRSNENFSQSTKDEKKATIFQDSAAYNTRGVDVNGVPSSWNLIDGTSTILSDGKTDSDTCNAKQGDCGNCTMISKVNRTTLSNVPASHNSTLHSTEMNLTDWELPSMEKSAPKKQAQGKVSALMSFWKSLSDTKEDASKEKEKGAALAEEDVIEEYSSDDAFQPSEFASQPARKLSLCGNAAITESFAACNASSGVAKWDEIPLNFKPTDRTNGFDRFPKCTDRNNLDKPYELGKSNDVIIINDHNSAASGVSNFARETTQENNYANEESNLSSDFRIQNLLRHRLPHFIPVNALRDGLEQVYIDYENQFAGGGIADGASILQSRSRRVVTNRSQVSRKKEKSTIADNDGWVRPHSKAPAQTQKRKKTSNIRTQPQTKAPVNLDRTDGEYGAGHWLTERTGKRIYITQDGRKLSGSSAYKQHLKDSGKRSKKTKRRRPRAKKIRSR